LPPCRCKILRLKCTISVVGWGYAPDPAGGAYSAPPDPIAGFKGPIFKGRRGKRKEWREYPSTLFCGSTPMGLGLIDKGLRLGPSGLGLNREQNLDS